MSCTQTSGTRKGAIVTYGSVTRDVPFPFSLRKDAILQAYAENGRRSVTGGAAYFERRCGRFFRAAEFREEKFLKQGRRTKRVG
jgi:hypothetical protein